ncbi:MAG: class I SAM-dependent methyltransferase [Magnetococcales bacterium]|nr:class I SAM-dependent methyltransferase [Magnetococcales bacterium]
MTERYFDATTGRIVCLQAGCDASFWSAHWQQSLQQAGDLFRHPPAYHSFLYVTKRYLPTGGRVIDAGCGLALTVHALARAGYEAYGVDYSLATVSTVHRHWPHLPLSCQDIRQLAFADRFFDGYWSLGVIEHFYDGYAAVLQEMARTIRPSGYLFLTFPAMNVIRRRQAAKGAYPPFHEDAQSRETFYQYMLPTEVVRRQVEAAGFRLVSQWGQSVVRTCKEEWPWTEKWLDRLLGLPFGIGRAFALALDLMFGKWAGHMALMIFQRQEPNG